jgi:hypothetical protein
MSDIDNARAILSAQQTRAARLARLHLERCLGATKVYPLAAYRRPIGPCRDGDDFLRLVLS